MNIALTFYKSAKLFPSIIRMVILFLLFLPSVLFSQGWKWENPLPFGDPVLVVFFVDKNHGWMAPENNTLFKTMDGGINWRIVYTDILFENIFFLDPFEGWGIGRVNLYSETNSIYHTTDGGESWEIQLEDTTVRYEIFFLNKKLGWATGDFNGTINHYSHLFKTTDGGNSWNPDAINQLGFGDKHKGVYFLDSLKGWLVGELSFGVKTIDGGETWQIDSIFAGIQNITSADSLHLWGLSDYDYIVKTTNGGANWTKHKIIDTTVEVRASDIYALDTNNIYVSTSAGFFGSNDGGNTFHFISVDLRGPFTFTGLQEIWGTGNLAIYHSTNGGKNWSNLVQTNNEFGKDLYNAVDFVDQNTGWIAGDKTIIGTGGFILKTTTGGENWITQYFNEEASFRDIVFVDENNGIAVGTNGLIIKTSDGGNSWFNKHSGNNYILHSVTFTDMEHGWAVGGNFDGGVILKTSDTGNTWIEIKPPFGITRCTAISFIDSLTGWVAAGSGSGEGMLLKTTDSGTTWIIQRQVSEMYFNVLFAKNSLEVWAGGRDPELNSTLIYTSDGGFKWNSKPLVAQGIYDIKFTDENNGWLISLREAFHTTDGGNKWIKQNLYSARSLSAIDLINNETGWIVGTWGTVLHTTNGGVSFIDDHRQLPSIPGDINIYQNYPNPFNPDTKIKIYLNSYYNNTTIKIINLLGQDVIELYNGFLSAGEHIFSWDGRDLIGREVSSGVYFSVIKGNDRVLVKKMIKLK